MRYFSLLILLICCCFSCEQENFQAGEFITSITEIIPINMTSEVWLDEPTTVDGYQFSFEQDPSFEIESQVAAIGSVFKEAGSWHIYLGLGQETDNTESGTRASRERNLFVLDFQFSENAFLSAPTVSELEAVFSPGRVFPFGIDDEQVMLSVWVPFRERYDLRSGAHISNYPRGEVQVDSLSTFIPNTLPQEGEESSYRIVHFSFRGDIGLYNRSDDLNNVGSYISSTQATVSGTSSLVLRVKSI